MHLRTLRAVVEVVEQGGFSQAARVVCATQSSVSKSIKSLENKLGRSLFDRVGQRSRLTPAGEIVYRRALAILAEHNNLMTELHAIPDLARGVLRLGLPAAGGATRFAALFAAYRKRYPGIRIELIEHDYPRLATMLTAGELDIAAMLTPLTLDFASQAVGSEALVVIMAAGHALAGWESVGLEQLAQFPFVLHEAGVAINPLILAACRRRGYEPTIAARSAQIDFIVELVAADLGIAFLPASLAGRYVPSGIHHAHLDAPDLDLRMALAWRRDEEPGPAARAWLELAQEMHSC